MSITVDYKGERIAESAGNALTLLTAGKYMEADVILSASGGGGAPIVKKSYNVDSNLNLHNALALINWKFKYTQSVLVLYAVGDTVVTNYTWGRFAIEHNGTTVVSCVTGQYQREKSVSQALDANLNTASFSNGSNNYKNNITINADGSITDTIDGNSTSLIATAGSVLYAFEVPVNWSLIEADSGGIPLEGKHKIVDIDGACEIDVSDIGDYGVAYRISGISGAQVAISFGWHPTMDGAAICSYRTNNTLANNTYKNYFSYDAATHTLKYNGATLAAYDLRGKWLFVSANHN